jgi:hypothetical protein
MAVKLIPYSRPTGRGRLTAETAGTTSKQRLPLSKKLHNKQSTRIAEPLNIKLYPPKNCGR